MLLSPLTPATFRTRTNRFLGLAEIDGCVEECFIPNPGRMKELLNLGVKVYLRRCESEVRKTRWDLALVDHKGILVSVDSRVPNTVIEESINAGLIPEFHSYRVDHCESHFGDSRFDLCLIKDTDTALVEVKSCTLVENGVALFPDAPTKRGTRHLHTLGEALHIGRSALIFLIQRGDATSLSPNQATNLAFANALRDAQFKGVEVYAYNSKVTLWDININRRVPVNI